MYRKYILLTVMLILRVNPGIAQIDTLWSHICHNLYDDGYYRVVRWNDQYVAAGYTDANTPWGANFQYDTYYRDGFVQGGTSIIADGEDRATSVELAPDGGYFVIGFITDSTNGTFNGLVHKVNPSGELEYSRNYSSRGNEKLFHAIPHSNGETLLIGYSDSGGAGSFDGYTILIDSAGFPININYYGGPGQDFLYHGTGNSESGYILVGETESSGAGEMDIWVVRLDAAGQLIWERTYGGTGEDRGFCLTTLNREWIIIAGSTASWGSGAKDAFLMMTDIDGNEVWTQTYGGTGIDEVFWVEKHEDGGYLLAGWTESFGINGDAMLIQTGDSGEEEWMLNFGLEGTDKFRCLRHAGGDRWVLVGETSSWGSRSESFIMLVNLLEGTQSECSEENKTGEISFTVSPNPFNPVTTIGFELRKAGFVELTVFDITGRSAGSFRETPLQGWYSAGTHEVVWDAGDCASGVYFVQLSAGDLSLTQKIILLK